MRSFLLWTASLFALCGPAFAQCPGVTFDAPVRYAVSASTMVRVADLDGDRAPDIVTSGNQVEQLGALAVLANRGDGSFTAEQPVTTGFGQRIEDIADVDRDGVPDLLLADYWQNGMVVQRGLGSLHFADGVPYPTATHGGPTRLLDTDGDGVRDIVSFSFGSGNLVRVHIFRGHADGTFEPKRTFDAPYVMAANPSVRFRQGSPEVLFSERSGHLGLLRFVNGGIDVTRLDAGPGFDLSSLFADVDGDGLADIVDVNDGGAATATNPYEWIFVRLATPDGGFAERKQLQLPRTIDFPTDLRAADFDGDGHLDIAVEEFRTNTLHVFRGDGHGTFAAAVPVDAGGPVNDFAAADVNGDGRPDLITVNADHSVSVILNRTPCPPLRRRVVRH